MHWPKPVAPFKIRPAAFRCLLALALLAGAPLLPAQTFTNKALKLDGKGSYVELPRDIFKSHTQATIEVWARWAEFGSFSRVFEFGASYHSVSLFNNATNNDLRFNIYPRMAKSDQRYMFVANARGLLRTNEWVHIAAVCGPGGMKLYANGRLVAQHTNTAAFADILTTQTNLIGHGLAGNPTDRDFRGEIDELRVWDHRRTLEQIRDHMFKSLSGKEEGLTHLWNFNDGTAKDSGPEGHHGKFIGKARAGRVDLDLTPLPPPAPPAPPAVTNLAATPPPAPATNVAAAAAIPAPVPAPPNTLAVWGITGALIALVALLAWLVMLLRRSGLGSARLIAPVTPQALGGGDARALPGVATDDEMKQRALENLTDFAKQSLVQGLYSQRAALLETHQKAQNELAELEARIVALRLPDRIQAYESRISELETQLESRNDELHELTQATLQLLRQRLAEEKQKEGQPPRFN